VSTKNLRLSPPADTILDSLEALGWTQADLAERMGLKKSEIEALVMNRTRITTDIAEALSRTIGGSTRFWLNCEANYLAALAERRGRDRSEDRA
jgi:HTH-type transcriptional regulator / antitoxin HigA